MAAIVYGKKARLRVLETNLENDDLKGEAGKLLRSIAPFAAQMPSVWDGQCRLASLWAVGTWLDGTSHHSVSEEVLPLATSGAARRAF